MNHKIFLTFFTLCFIYLVQAEYLWGQTNYDSTIYAYRLQYVQDLLAEPRAPLPKEHAGDLRFFDPDSTFRIAATVELLPNTDTIAFATSSGVKKVYTRYALAKFVIHQHVYQLTIFQSPLLKTRQGLEDHLFLPFKDLSNGTQTYEGGRYIDLTFANIVNGQVVLDFNKCYNPYCAYSGGFACPVPPRENFLQVAIQAGEQKPSFEH